MPSSRYSTHNLGMDFFKFCASIFIVFVHAPFPGTFGRILSCPSHTGVLGFFAISGFFSYEVSSDRLLRRIKHLIHLNIWGILLTLSWGCIGTELGLGSMAVFQHSMGSYLRSAIPPWNLIVSWFITDVNHFNGYYWYLMAALKCYIVLWCYVRFFGKEKPNYQALYIAGVLLFSINLLLGVVSTALYAPNDFMLLRGTLLLGIPMFTLGIFLRQYWERIWENFQLTGKKLACFSALGIVLSIIEQETIGVSDAYIGSVLTIISLILLMARYPSPFQKPFTVTLVKKFGNWSVGIYLVHSILVWNDFLSPQLASTVPHWSWTRPLFVLAFSLIATIVNDLIWFVAKKFKDSLTSCIPSN